MIVTSLRISLDGNGIGIDISTVCPVELIDSLFWSQSSVFVLLEHSVVHLHQIDESLVLFTGAPEVSVDGTMEILVLGCSLVVKVAQRLDDV